jgi:hypothetical protein
MTLHPLGKGMKYLLHGLSWFQPPQKNMKVIGYHPNYGWKHVGNTPNKYIPLLQLLNRDYLVMVPCQSPWRSAVGMNQKTPISWRIMAFQVVPTIPGFPKRCSTKLNTHN